MILIERKDLELAATPGRCPSVLLSHPTGNQNVRNALRSLAERDMLAEFWTTLAWDQKSCWNRFLPSRLRTQLEKRAFDDAPKERVKCVPWRELVRLSLRSVPLNRVLCSGERPFSVIGMYRQFDGRVARRLAAKNVTAVYAYEGGALQTFRTAKQLGMKTIYELPSGHWYWERKLMSEDAEKNSEFAELHPKLRESPGHMKWKDEELRLADYVFVPSQHVRRTLAGIVPDERIRVVNYGTPPLRRRKDISQDPGQPLRVLFVGAMTQRKGIGYLLEAIETLGPQVELTLVGSRFAPNPRVDAACKRWRWFKSIPHDEVLDIMAQADVLVLPSLSEGFGLAVTEALACGLPVIITPNVGAGDLIREGQNGFIVPICSAAVIAERLKALNCDRQMLLAMSHHAVTTAQQRSWSQYRAEWAEAVRAVCSQ